MATGKRALIVDDSRSARVILSRMLEQHGMAVDTAESAEQALEFLKQSRPDVIFMDHLMPGMDGFEAVQAIKGDPQTAMIPLMMYTSQEGELYVSQARALGAIGVLPKTVRPVDVSRILYQLHLLPERRTQRSALFDAAARAAAVNAEVSETTDQVARLGSAGAEGAPGPAGVSGPGSGVAPGAAPWAATPAVLAELQAQVRQSTQAVVRDQLGEQRRFLLATFEAFARRLTNELKDELAKVQATPAAPVESGAPRRGGWLAPLVSLLAIVPAGVLGWLLWQSQAVNRELVAELDKARAANKVAQSAVAALTAAAALPPADPSAAEGVADGDPGLALAGPIAMEYVPYGETPFGNARLDRLRALAATLEVQKFHGRVRVEYYVADFCLTGNANEGYAVADATLPSPKCDLVGNPFDDALSPAQRQSVDFANFAAMLNQRTGGAITVEAVNAGRHNRLAFPDVTEKTTAGEWNAIAAQNHRVEFRVVPAA
jgi:CheY-like chemotaxis protein